jgi:hypothetical protein
LAKASILVKILSASSPSMPLAAIPSKNRPRSFSIFSVERLAPMARRSSSASPAENPATSTATCMSCSWNSGTPSVLSSAFLSSGWSCFHFSWSLRRRM